MGEVINCNYARFSIRYFNSKHLLSSCRFPKRSILKILADYNHHVTDNENLKGTYSLTSRKLPTICQRFNRQWNPTEAWEEYLTTFSVTAWKKLFPEEKQQHTLQKCKACETQFQVLSATFPCKLGNKRKPLIFFNKNFFCHQQGSVERHCRSWTHWRRKISANLWYTKRSQLSKRPTSDEWKWERQWVECEVWDDMQKDKDATCGQTSHAEQDQLESLQQNQKDWRACCHTKEKMPRKWRF